MILCTTGCAQNIKLPASNKDGGKPLMQALNERQTHRDFSAKQLSDQQLSDLLWAAVGVNRPDGKRTAPTARNCQQIEVYVFMEKGVYLYDAKENMLKLMVKGDQRKMVAMQPFPAEAPVLLVMVANYDKMTGMDMEHKEFYGATDCGYVCQNIYLYCASEGLHTVSLGSIQRDKIKDLLKFNGKAILAHPVGFGK